MPPWMIGWAMPKSSVMRVLMFSSHGATYGWPDCPADIDSALQNLISVFAEQYPNFWRNSKCATDYAQFILPCSTNNPFAHGTESPDRRNLAPAQNKPW